MKHSYIEDVVEDLIKLHSRLVDLGLECWNERAYLVDLEEE